MSKNVFKAHVWSMISQQVNIMFIMNITRYTVYHFSLLVAKAMGHLLWLEFSFSLNPQFLTEGLALSRCLMWSQLIKLNLELSETSDILSSYTWSLFLKSSLITLICTTVYDQFFNYFLMNHIIGLLSQRLNHKTWKSMIWTLSCLCLACRQSRCSKLAFLLLLDKSSRYLPHGFCTSSV